MAAVPGLAALLSLPPLSRGPFGWGWASRGLLQVHLIHWVPLYEMGLSAGGSGVGEKVVD